MSTSKRRILAFTLVELLVVIAIVAMLVVLLLPAIQDAREAARRISCMSKARQLGTAVVSFEAANRKFPPPAVGGGLFFLPGAGNPSWFVRLLPFVEEQSLYDQFDLEKTLFEQDANPAGTQLTFLMCPSGTARGRFFRHDTLTENTPLAKTNYAAWASPYHLESQHMWPAAISGIGVKAKKVSDGLSKTLLLSEVRTSANPNDQRGAWAIPWNGASLLAYDGHHDATMDSRHFYPFYRLRFTMQTPNHQRHSNDMTFECDEAESQLNKMPCAKFSKGVKNFDFLISAPRSFHPGGVNATFLDGHAAFVTDDVDPIVMALEVSINDGRHRDDFPQP